MGNYLPPFLEKKAVLGVVDLFVVPLPFYIPRSFHMQCYNMDTVVCCYIQRLSTGGP